MALILQGEYQLNLGDAEGSMHTAREAYELSHQAECAFASLGAAVELAVALELTGRRQEAVVICQDTIERFSLGREPTPLLGFIYSRLGAFCFTANQLDLAHVYLEQGVELCHKLATDRVMGGKGKMTLGNVQLALGQLDLAQVLYALGRREEAWVMTSDAGSLVQRAGILPYVGKISALAAEFMLREGKVEAAVAQLKDISLSLEEEPNPSREEEYLVLVKGLLAQGHVQEAIPILEKLERSARNGGRQARLIPIYILWARASNRLGSRAEALDYLEKAIRLAEPGQYLRPFLDSGGETGGETANLLHKLRSVTPKFVEGILCVLLPNQDRSKDRGDSKLIEGLSERETEILRLVAQGLSNGEIAGKLFITPGTTKWHLNNIFSKLGVNSRIKAVSLAQVLKLL